jgi:hypothetical protein
MAETIHRPKIRTRNGGFGDTKIIKNRSSNRLVARVDNIEFPLEPGLNEVPAFIVPYAVRQNPIPGTMHIDGSVESYIAIEGLTPEDQMGLVPPVPREYGLADDLFDRNPATGKPLDPKRHEYVGVSRSNLVEGVSGRSEVSRVLGDSLTSVPGFGD